MLKKGIISYNFLKENNPTIFYLLFQVDYEPRHEAFWFVGGVDLPASVINQRRKQKHIYEGRFDQNVDRPVQYIGNYGLNY